MGFAVVYHNSISLGGHCPQTKPGHSKQLIAFLSITYATRSITLQNCYIDELTSTLSLVKINLIEPIIGLWAMPTLQNKLHAVLCYLRDLVL
jgi:hypothetical protein